MSSYQYRKSHCGDKTILRVSYLHNGISYTGKMASLYWIRAQVISSHGIDLVLSEYSILDITTVRVTWMLCRGIIEIFYTLPQPSYGIRYWIYIQGCWESSSYYDFILPLSLQDDARHQNIISRDLVPVCVTLTITQKWSSIKPLELISWHWSALVGSCNKSWGSFLPLNPSGGRV